MYIADNSQLGNFMDFIKKSRKLIHKLAPRELSPTRMLEKYQSDQAKKAQKKGEAKLAKAQADTDARIAQLKAEGAAAALSFGSGAESPLPASAAGPTSGGESSAAAPNYLLYGGVALAVVAVVMFARKKR